MPLAGIIAEFNPLHNGHKYLIDCAKNDNNDVACVISGNFVQRGDTAVVSKFNRAEMALASGADIVVELPVPWSMSTAQNFAFGAVSQLASLNIDALYFGSESGDIDTLILVSNILLSSDFKKIISSKIASGHTFAKLRRDTVCEILGFNTSVLDTPNDTLAVEYICATKRLGLNITFKAVKRIGAGHNDLSEADSFSTSTLLRSAISNGDFNYLNKYMPSSSLDILLNSSISDINRLDTAIISRLKQLKIEELSNLPDISEGLDNLLFNKILSSYSYYELCEATKSKRYTMARIRRLILSAYLGIDNTFFGKEPPYVRILGFSKTAKGYLTNYSHKPLVTRVSQIKHLDEISQKVFQLENSINEIYALSLNDPSKYINEQKQKILTK